MAGVYISRSRPNDRLSISFTSTRMNGTLLGSSFAGGGGSRHCDAHVRSYRFMVGSILYEQRSVSRVFLFAFVRYTEERREQVREISAN